ncbi:spermidine/putrescine ABC transporter substrate-binding protein [Roseofilum sp. BLCC_M154]|uniref:Spermidine/putrescine ABC transporter substrate-binding protein n=1 Tax=Roseofilum acuticapitatum BLCC-M154 TaxID=3022444 RepID=A0ABT7AP38_9CYAN|nr:spermidine/putrescine ABC transporter substrate-binding protein [Roseofilum acuticapitatum]MDJ1168660.1 spermidine/putrescine ABC transporter substrate-binding protein [Roseofilum acuticapitatum BLCC-M154]
MSQQDKPDHLSSSRPINRRRFLQGTTAALAGFGLSSCGWTLADVQTRSGERGDSNKLYIYTWAGYTDEDLLAQFEQQTGIQVIADVFDSNEAMLAKILAGGGGAYSIIYPSDYMVLKMVEDGLLTPLDLGRIEGLNQLFENYQNPPYDPGNGHSIPISWGTTGLIYNRQALGGEPENWEYLWQNQSQLSRQVTLLNDVREVMGATLKHLGYSLNSENAQEIEEAYEALVELKPAIASFTSDAWRPQILTGDLKIAMGYSVDASEIMEEDENLGYVIPKNGSSLWTDTLVIPKTAPNPDGAYAWINFMLQPTIAAEITKRLSFATANRVAYEQLPEEIQQDATLFPPPEVLANCESVSPVKDNIAQLYDRYWTQLTSS